MIYGGNNDKTSFLTFSFIGKTKLKNAELKQTVTVGTLSAAIVGIVLVAKYTNLLGSRH